MLAAVFALLATPASSPAVAAYNQLMIPPALTGPVFHLWLSQTNKAF